MEWFKKHADTIVILGAFASSMLWMNGKFNDIDHRLTVIETVLVLKNIMPLEMLSVKKSDVCVNDCPDSSK
jgi:hypothetical protein